MLGGIGIMFLMSLGEFDVVYGVCGCGANVFDRYFA